MLGFHCHKSLGRTGIVFKTALFRPVVTAAASTFLAGRNISKAYQSSLSFHSSPQRWPMTHGASFASIAGQQSSESVGLITGYKTTLDNDLVTVDFHDASFTFHAQWLHDARCDSGSARDAGSVYCQNPPNAFIRAIDVTRQGVRTTLDITWDNGMTSRFPAPWLRVLAPLVAKPQQSEAARNQSFPKGWLVDTLTIPEVPYEEIFSPSEATVMQILDDLLHESSAGLIKVTGLPAPSIEAERNKENTLVTQILKQIFGSVFVHPRRGADKTFNVASHVEEDVKRAIGLPNYDTNKILLPHADHAHYDHPIQIMGFYGLEGESENTFVSGFAVLTTLREEAPDLFEQICRAPIAIGRVAPYYDPPMNQATVDTAVTMYPGFPNKIKRFRWHPHLTGSLLTPFDGFHMARVAHQKFQEIVRRDTHQLKLPFKPGDLYLWDNFRLLHGRERVLKVPRTGVGQTVPEQVVTNMYRGLKIDKLKQYVDEHWLVHVPTPLLYDLLTLVDGQTPPTPA